MNTDILHHLGTNPEERKKLEIEQKAWRTVNAMFEDKERAFVKALHEKDIIIAELTRKLNE